MHFKTFTAQTMRDALAQVRQEYGDEAVILSTYDGGKGRVEVTAGLERPHTQGPSFDQGPLSTTPRISLQDPPVKRSAGLHASPLEQYQDIERALKRHRFPDRLLYRLIDLASTYDTTEPLMALAGALDEALRFSPIELNKLQKPLVVVGPPGVGKTVSIAKLAARALMQNLPIHLITVDTVHLGGIEQLTSFAQALNIQPHVARSPDDLASLLKRLPNKLTLIDTWGANPFDPDEMDHLYGYILASQGEPVLVLPTGYDKSESADIAKSFKQMGVLRVIFTRLDVARRLSCPITTALQTGLMLSEAGVTPHIADGLVAMDPLFLAEHLLHSSQVHKELAA